MSPLPATDVDSNAVSLRQVDIAILTIREDEFRALLKVFQVEPELLRGRRHYNLRTADAGGGDTYRVAIVRQVEQGNGEAQEAARDILEELQPKLLLVVGIAGGLPSDDFTLGDVIVSTRINDYCVEARKENEAPSYSISGGSVAKEIAMAVANLPAMEPELGNWTATLSAHPPIDIEKVVVGGPADWQETIREKLRAHFGSRRKRTPIATAGTLASSDRLVKDPSVLFPWIETARHVLAVEMESGGVYRAARDRALMLAIRGISDIIGLKRDDRWTKYACATAAAFTCAFLRTTPVMPSHRINREPNKPAPHDPSNHSSSRRSVIAVHGGQKDAPSGTSTRPLLASVLLPYQAQGLFMVRKGRGNNSLHNSADGPVVLMEELLSLGCVRVAVPAGTLFAGIAGRRGMKGRLVVVDQTKEVYDRTVALLGPVAEEMRLPHEGFESTTPVLPAQHVAMINEKNHARQKKIALLSYIFEHVYTLLLGLHYKLQISLDIGELLRAVIALRTKLRSPAARLNLSSIAGLLRLYETWTVQTLDALSTLREERSETFKALARDSTFRQMSEQAHLLGVPAQAMAAIDRIGILASQIDSDSRTHGRGISTRSRIIRGSPSLIVPNNDLEQQAYEAAFIPPIVPLKALIWQACERWRANLPRGHRHAIVVSSGREVYFPPVPHFLVKDLSGLKAVLAITDPVTTENIELFGAILASRHACSTHARFPHIESASITNGPAEFTLSFCCSKQETDFWKSMKLVKER